MSSRRSFRFEAINSISFGFSVNPVDRSEVVVQVGSAIIASLLSSFEGGGLKIGSVATLILPPVLCEAFR
jgi:hypothetical protein